MLLLTAQYLKVQLSAFLSKLVSFSSVDGQYHEFPVVATVMQDLVCHALQHLSVQQQLRSWGSLRKTSQRCKVINFCGWQEANAFYVEWRYK